MCTINTRAHTHTHIHTHTHTHTHTRTRTQISYASATSSLNDRTRFPNFWRTYPSEDNVVGPILAIVRHYGWEQLKIITQDETLFTPVREYTCAVDY